MQKPDEDKNIDASVYKGILPVHMRQGIPPYLQILFAARPTLPFITPVSKPHKLQISGLLDGTDYQRLRQRVEENAKAREAEMGQIGYLGPKKYAKRTKIMKQRHWEDRMSEHIGKNKQAYKEWLKTEVVNATGKSSNPLKTLVVARLVV